MSDREITRDEKLALMKAKVQALAVGYETRWRNTDWEIREVEKVYESDLWNPATQRRSRSFRLAGKVDLLINLNDRMTVVDHKTTSDDIEDPASDYWRQLVVEGQLSHYMLLLWLNGVKVDFGIWDVLRKPGISPRQITKAEAKMLEIDRKWFGYGVPDQEIKAALSIGRETLVLYQARLMNDCITVRPQHYFQRRPFHRLDAEIHEYASEVWDHGQDLLNAINTERHVRNSGACMEYGGACKFLGICSGHDSADSDKWRQKQWVHPELPAVNGDGRDLLTNTRIRTFQTCRRRHQLSYLIGIERADDEERESLVFGRLWHEALEQYFIRIKEQQNGNANSASEPVNEVGCGTGTP